MLLASRSVRVCCRQHTLSHSARCLVLSIHQHQRPHTHKTTNSSTTSNSTRAVHHAPAAATAAATAAPPPIDQEQQSPAAASSLAAGLSFADRPGVWDNSIDSSKLLLKNLTFDELAEWCESMGHDARKALLLWKAMYQDGRWARSITTNDDSANTNNTAGTGSGSSSSRNSSTSGSGATGGLQLSSALKAAVQQHASLDGGLTLQSVTTARDGTHKLVFALHGGPASGNVETVLIPMRDRGGQRLRYTACLSSQVGCAQNCQFCYTGRMGLLGNLTTAQIVEQLVEARRWLADYTATATATAAAATQQQQPLDGQLQQEQSSVEQDAQGQVGSSASSSSSSGGRAAKKGGRKGSSNQQGVAPRIGNIVFMGMGEPLHNPAVTPALDILCHPQGLALSRNKVIVSTVGLVGELRKLRASGKAKLAVSLHATTDEVRSWIVPTNRRYPLSELIGTLEELYPLNNTPADGADAEDTSVAAGGSSESSSDTTTTSSSTTISSSSDTTTTTSSSSSKEKKPRRAKPASDDFVIIEYCLLKDVNDTDDDAHRLLALLANTYCMINLIVFNPHEGTPFEKSDEAQAKRFQKIIQAGGKVCTLRLSKGDDEMAACGQLGGASMDLAKRPAPMLQPPERLQDSLPGAAAAATAVAAMRSRGQQQQGGLAAGCGGRARELLLKKRRQSPGVVAPRV